MSESSEDRYVVQARLLGTDDESNKKRRKSDKEFAIDVTLSEESSFVIFRTVREITVLHTKLVAQFPVEAGYFAKKEAVIPDCPLKMTIFGPSRIVREDRVFEKLLNSYIKELPALPASIVKCELVNKFFQLRPSDMSEPGTPQKSAPKKRRKSAPVKVTADSSITGPMRLRSYYAVAAYNDSKTKFSFAEGAVVQVLQKDASGWWMVDASGMIGWAPASFLVPVDEEDLAEEAKENEKLMSSMRVGARYISMSAYQASRDDEISFVSGAIVRLIKKYADGWWLVRYNGGEGFVPGSMFRKFDRRQGTAYVKNIRRKFHARKSTRIIPTMQPKWMKDPSGTGLMLYQCLTRYKGSDSSEISLNKNDIVKVLDKKDHGWWFVEDRRGRTGWAPATYLGPVVDRSKKDANPRQRNVVGSTHEVRASYTAREKDELTVASGDAVTVLSAPDDGWWVVCKMSTMEQGLIPSVCLNEMTSEPKEGEEPEKPSTEILDSIKELSGALEEKNGEEEEEEELEEEDDDVEINISDGYSYSSDVDDVMLDNNCYVAAVSYTKQAQDELSVHEGQVVCVVDDSDKSMFYVVVDGKEGWLPSDILKMEPAALSRRSSVGSSISSYSHGGTRSRSISPSPMASPLQSRSPSPMTPMDLPDFNQSRLPHQHSNPSTPSRTHLKPTPVRRQALRTRSLEASKTNDGATTKAKATNTSLVEIHVEEQEGASLEDIEKAALEAERAAQEAQRRAAELRERAQRAKCSYTPKDDSD